MTQMKGAAARDGNHINEAINVSAFSRLQTRERVPVRSTQSCWQLKGKLRSITVRAAASVAQQTTQTWCQTCRTPPRRRPKSYRASLQTCLQTGKPPAICSICLGGAWQSLCRKKTKIWRRNPISPRCWQPCMPVLETRPSWFAIIQAPWLRPMAF